MGREPLLLVALVARLEVLPLLQRGGLDPGRAKARADRQVRQARQVTELPGGRARPHPGQLSLGRRAVPEPLAEQHPPARVDEPPEFGQRGRRNEVIAWTMVAAPAASASGTSSSACRFPITSSITTWVSLGNARLASVVAMAHAIVPTANHG